MVMTVLADDGGAEHRDDGDDQHDNDGEDDARPNVDDNVMAMMTLKMVVMVVAMMTMIMVMTSTTTGMMLGSLSWIGFPPSRNGSAARIDLYLRDNLHLKWIQPRAKYL
eukprot:9304306-Karenia_brevis.AAC.1